MKRIYGIIFAMLSSAAFSFMPIFAKELYNNNINTLTVLSLRFTVAALILLCYFIIKNVNIKVSKTQFLILFLIGFLGYTSTGLTLFLSYNYIDVGIATTMHFIYPALVMILNYLIYKERITKKKITALIISVLGVYVLIGITSKPVSLFGSLLALSSGLTYACCVMGMNHREVKKLDNTVMVFYFGAFAGVTLFAFTGFTGNFNFNLNIKNIIYVSGISFISTILSITLFIKALKHIGATSTSILGTFEPVVSIIMGILLFNEKLTITLILGGILILSSVVILAMEKLN